MSDDEDNVPTESTVTPAEKGKVIRRTPAAAKPKTPKVKLVPRPTEEKTTVKETAPEKPSDLPTTAVMVNEAVKGLAKRGGSSLKAIKNYMSDHYNVDAEKRAPFIKKYLKLAVTSGTLVQVKGKGANGSFKLPVKSGIPKPKKTASEEVASPKKVVVAKKPAVKKVVVVSPGKAPPAKAPPAKKAPAKKSPVQKAPPKSPAQKVTLVKKTTIPKTTASVPMVVASPAPPKAAGKVTKAKKRLSVVLPKGKIYPSRKAATTKKSLSNK